MNVAVSDTVIVAEALVRYYQFGNRDLLDRYSETCLRRVWMVQRFSWRLTSLLHRLPDAEAFDRRGQIAELDYVCGSRAAAMTLAENYTGLPMRAAKFGRYPEKR